MGVKEFLFVVYLLVIIGTGFVYSKLRLGDGDDRRMRGYHLMSAAVIGWTVLEAMSLFVLPEYFQFVFYFKMIFVSTVPYIACWFILNYIESTIVDSRVIKSVFVIMPILHIVFVLTNPWHFLFISEYTTPAATPGSFYIVHITAIVTTVLFVYVFLFRYIIDNMRRHPIILLTGVGAILPLVLNLLYSLPVFGFGYDLGPIGFFCTVTLFGYSSYATKAQISQPGQFRNNLARIAKSPILSAGNIEAAVKLIAKEGCNALGATCIALWLLSEDKKTLKKTIVYETDETASMQTDEVNTETEAEYRDIIFSERLFCVSDIRKANTLSGVICGVREPTLCAYMDAPIHVDGSVYGVISVEQHRCKEFPLRREWTFAEQNFTSSLADFMAIAVEGYERNRLMRRTEQIINNLPGMVYQCERAPGSYSFVFTYISENSLSVSGYTPEELSGQNTVKLLNMIHPDDKAMFFDNQVAILEKGLQIVTKARIILPDGTIKWVWDSSRIIEKYPDGTPLSLVGFIMDITEQRRLEEAERKLEIELNHANAANKAKNEFMAKMSHEIRTPMNAIIGMSELVLRENLSDIVREHTTTVKQAGMNLLSIINDILDLSKIESGNMQIVPANYYLSSLTNDVVNIIKMRTLDSHIRFIVNIDSNLPNALVGDETRVRQIMLNILNNAVKYTESGFVSLTVNGEITGEEELTLLVDVEDSGIGIHKDNIDKLFNHYYQVETTSVSEGVGLGLSITQSMLEAMDGNISVESTLGVGSKFTIQIPQKYRGAKKLAVVNDPTIQCIIYFERRMKYAESLMNTIINLGVACRLVNDAGFLHDIVSRETIHYVFLANTMFKAHIETLEKYFKPRQIVLLTDFGESTPPGQWNVISMPAHAISVANLFNGETSNYSYKNNEDRSTRFVAPNAKILIVDDIRTNLKIAGGLLLPYKTELDTCLSGYEALIAVEKKRYDVIFMDHRMPGMDGMEATKRIRDMTGEDGYFQSVPIIALTANAVSGMKELFMENGFSDFLSKPIDVPKLNELLEKWIPKEKQMNNYEKTPITPNPPKAKTELKDIAELDMAVGLQMVGDSMELYHLTLSSVVEEGRDIIPKIKEHISEANMPACTILFHALKGLMQTIGSKTLSVTAYELENAGSQGDTEYVTARVDDFLTSLEVLLADIEGAVETGESNQ